MKDYVRTSKKISNRDKEYESEKANIILEMRDALSQGDVEQAVLFIRKMESKGISGMNLADLETRANICFGIFVELPEDLQLHIIGMIMEYKVENIPDLDDLEDEE